MSWQSREGRGPGGRHRRLSLGKQRKLFALLLPGLAISGASPVGSPRRAPGERTAATPSARQNAMKRTWTILGVKDVARSFRWYLSLFGQPARPPAHSYFGQVLDADGTVLLCLHQWGAEDHPPLRSPDAATPGNGLLLFFRVD